MTVSNPAHVNTVVIGASAFGCAYAASHSEDIIILEPSLVLCSEFASTFRCRPVDMSVSFTQQGQEMVHEMLQRNILDSEGNISIPPVTGLFAKQLLAAKVPVMLGCEMVKITLTDKYKIDYFNSDGFGSLTCNRLIDTSSLGTLHNSATKYRVTKTLRAALSANESASAIMGYSKEGIFAIKGRFDTEYALCLNLNIADDWIAARKKLSSIWEKLHITSFKGWNIAAICSFFDYEYEHPIAEEITPNFFWIPSCAYSTVMDAFEGGIVCSL